MRSRADVGELEEVAYDLWRAPVVEELDGWRLRFAHGLTGRANSVWPNRGGDLPLAEKVDRAEAWYARRGMPARFQVTDAAEVGLEEALGACGYEQSGAAVSVETADLDDVLVGTEGDAAIGSEPDEGWLSLWAGSRGFERLDVVRALLTGSPGRSALARIDDAAAGRAVVLGDWLGVTSMVTAPHARRRGHARAILHALAVWGAEEGATRAVLQVEEHNAAARALYGQAGFTQSHAYRYLVSP